MKIIFYNCPLDILEIGAVYTFALFLLDPATDERIVFNYPDVEYTQEHQSELEAYVAKGAQLQIHEQFLEEFKSTLGITDAQLREWNIKRFKMIALYNKRQEEFEALKNPEFKLQDTIQKINNSDNYEALRVRVRADLLGFPLDKDPVINFTLALVEQVFIRDLYPVKNAVIAYFIAKELGLKDELVICEIILAALVKDLSFSMCPPSIFEQWEILKSNDHYLKHPFLSLYYLAKLDLHFSKELKRIIMEHHEDTLGEGFPRGKKENYIAMSSFILNLSEQIILSSTGVMPGGLDLVSVIRNLAKQNKMGDMNLNIPQHILESLNGLIPVN